jgi:two-component system nitrogen regulation response regulator GlnG
MSEEVGRQDSHELRAVARLIADAVPRLVEQLATLRPGRVHREALVLLERPLLRHALVLARGNQLRAARMLGLNRNTLRKRCRELQLATSPQARGARPQAAQARLS